MSYPLTALIYPGDDFMDRKPPTSTNAIHPPTSSPDTPLPPSPTSPTPVTRAHPRSRPAATTTYQSSSRLPPPALFQGPPSPNASTLDLHRIPTVTAPLTPGIGLERIVTKRRMPEGANRDPNTLLTAGRVSQEPTLKTTNAESGRRPLQPQRRIPSSSSAFAQRSAALNLGDDEDRAAAQWAEMQNTLANVEVSASAAAVGGAEHEGFDDGNALHIFGEGHAKALDALREAQLGLATAWGRSGGATDVDVDVDADVSADEGQEVRGGEDNEDGDGNIRASSRGGGKKKTLQEETEDDIQLAKKRRNANDVYFEQVNSAVVDVVRKLDEVAAAMRRVEKESRDIWDDEDEDKEKTRGKDSRKKTASHGQAQKHERATGVSGSGTGSGSG